MKKPIIAVVALAALLTTLTLHVTAQSRYDFAGSYTVSGTNPDGSTYKQNVIVTDYGDGYRVNYDDGETGVANDLGTTIAVGSQNKGIPTVTILKIVNSKQLSGYWQDYNNTKEGQETWTEN